MNNRPNNPAPARCAGANGCTHDCRQGRACASQTPAQPTQGRGLLWWLVAVAVALLMAGAMALLGKPQDQ